MHYDEEFSDDDLNRLADAGEAELNQSECPGDTGMGDRGQAGRISSGVCAGTFASGSKRMILTRYGSATAANLAPVPDYKPRERSRLEIAGDPLNDFMNDLDDRAENAGAQRPLQESESGFQGF